MKNWQKLAPPYEGEEPYLYFAFADEDRARVWGLLCALLERGCRVWYSLGPAGSARELLRRQARTEGAALTLLYLSDAACADKDTKSAVLVNQKQGRPLLSLDPDGVDRRLSMGLRESAPHIPLRSLAGTEAAVGAVMHAQGFSQTLLGEPVKLAGGGLSAALTRLFFVLAAVLALLSLGGIYFFHWFQPQDELAFSDPVILSAVREAAQGGAITEELTADLRVLRLEALPEDWDELRLLPALETVELPQEAVLQGGELPAGYTVVLIGGSGHG